MQVFAAMDWFSIFKLPVKFIDTFGMAIPAVCLGFAFLVILVVLPMQGLYGERRIAARLAAGLGLSQLLRKPGLRLDLEWSSFADAQLLYAAYTADLGPKAEGVSLSREGWKSGMAALQGGKEKITGDIDFDDYFWVESGGDTYLTPARRSLLLSVFPYLDGDARIEKGQLKGRIRCEQSPFGVKATIRMIERVESLQTDLLDPDNVRPTQRTGWVGRQKRRSVAIRCWLAAVPMLAIGAAATTALWALGDPDYVYDFVVALGLLLTGLLMVSTGIAVLAGSKVTLRLARAVQVLGSLTSLLTAPYWLNAATVIGIFVCAGMALGAIYGLHLAYAAISRLRLG